MAKTYSPLRYPGGKSALMPFLMETIYLNQLQGCTYIEPFAGGAGAALGLLFGEHVDKIVINDVDFCIYAFWHSIMNNTDKFLALVNDTDVNIEEWHKQREIYNKCDKRSLLKVGFATFFLNRCNRSGILKKAGPIGGKGQSGNWKIDARFNKKNLIERLERVASYGERIAVSNLNANDLLININSQKSNENILVYLDPPYYNKGAELYINHFLHDDHANLSTQMCKYESFKWLISYDNVTQIKDMYQEMNIIEFSLNYHTSNPRKGSEILIFNDTIKVPSTLLGSKTA